MLALLGAHHILHISRIWIKIILHVKYAMIWWQCGRCIHVFFCWQCWLWRENCHYFLYVSNSNKTVSQNTYIFVIKSQAERRWSLLYRKLASISGLTSGHNAVSNGQSVTAIPKYMNRESFNFGTIAKLRKEVINFVMSFFLFVARGKTRLPLVGFSYKLMFENFYKIC